jgi:hypothetical protein
LTLRFLDFAARLGFRPEPGQEAALRVAFHGEEPADVGPLAVQVFGYERGTPARARDVIEFVWGARGGKTFWSALRMLHLACTVPVGRLAPGEPGFVFLVAPKLDLAEQALAYIKGAILQDKTLAERSEILAERITLRRTGGKSVVICPVAASRGGTGQRGRSLLGALLDETAFFRDETTGAVNDAAIFRAIAPRVIEGGQVVVQSTPWARSGLLYELHRENWGQPHSALVAHAPTLLLRSDPKIRSYVEREFARDPENARIEFGAEFGSASSSQFFSESDLDLLFDADAPTQARPGDTVSAAVDLGFVRNSASICVIAGQQAAVVVDLQERLPAPDRPLSPSEVCSEFTSVLMAHRCFSAVSDAHYKETLREHTDAFGVSLYDSCGPAERFLALRTAIRSGQIKASPTLPLASRLRQQLQGVRARHAPGGQLSVTMPSALDGSHGDLADALARCVWGRQRYGGSLIPVPVAEVDALEQDLLSSRERRVSQEIARPWYRRSIAV